MLPNLKKQFDTVEKSKNDFLTIIQQATPEQQQFKPTDKSWNMLDVAEHLLLAEKGVLYFLEKYPPRKTTFWQNLSAKIRSIGLNFVLKFPFKYKAPSVTKPKGGKNFDELHGDWAVTRQKIGNKISTYTADQQAHSIFKHPLSGNLSPAQTLSFMDEHIAHHRFQLQRIQEAAHYPKK